MAPGGGGAQALAAATMCPGRRLPACRDRATRAGCGRGCSTLQHRPAPVLSELELNTKCVVEMEGNQTVLHPPPSNTKQGER